MHQLPTSHNATRSANHGTLLAADRQLRRHRPNPTFGRREAPLQRRAATDGLMQQEARLAIRVLDGGSGPYSTKNKPDPAAIMAAADGDGNSSRWRPIEGRLGSDDDNDGGPANDVGLAVMGNGGPTAMLIATGRLMAGLHFHIYQLRNFPVKHRYPLQNGSPGPTIGSVLMKQAAGRP